MARLLSFIPLFGIDSRLFAILVCDDSPTPSFGQVDEPDYTLVHQKNDILLNRF
jgi:hypothetical protein